MTEKILIIGAGIAGLFAGLALSRAQPGAPRRDIQIFERDPAPPDSSPDLAFGAWRRQGVLHMRHSHAFLARLHGLLRDRYPDLLGELLAAGCRELTFAHSLPATLREAYVPQPGDEDLTILTSRRTTLEYVIRGYAARQIGVRFWTGATVRGLLTEPAANSLRVTGIRAEHRGVIQNIPADLVVDAGGKHAPAPAALRQAGLSFHEEREPAGIVYFTRHYRLRDGRDEPERGRASSAGDLGYLKYGVFPGDNRCFSITLAVPEIEHDLRRAIRHAETFDKICSHLPGIARWTDPATSAPYSDSLAMGGLENVWRHMLRGGSPRVLNFFPVGDSLIRTNPLYGRGCSFAAIQAQKLHAALTATTDPAARAKIYHREVWRDLRPFYDHMVKQDLSAIRRAHRQHDPGYRPRLRARLTKRFIEDGIAVALRADIELMRAALRAFHMLEPPTSWLTNPRNLSRIMHYWLRGKRRNAAFYPPALGPTRAAMLATLGLI